MKSIRSPLSFALDRIAELEADNARFRAALNELACWDDGPTVIGRFDDPHSASVARQALGSSPVPIPGPVEQPDDEESEDGTQDWPAPTGQ